MLNRNWRRIGLGAMAVGAAAGIWAALNWGNRYLDQFEDTPHDQHAQGDFVSVGEGWRIHYTVQGAGSPIVLVHGFMDSLQTWRRNAHVLAQKHRVYAIDVLGFGCSDRVCAPIYTLKQQARFLKEFFDMHGIQQAAVMGHSMGGALALQFAYDFPEQVHKLVLIAPATFLYGAVPSDSLRPIPRHVSRGVLGIYERFQGNSPNALRRAYGKPERITQDALDLRNRMMRIRGTHDALIAMTKSRREANVPQELQQVTVPTLIVWGTRDRILPPSHAHRHYRALPNARLEWIETAGHLPHEEEPDSVNELVKHFLDEE